LFWTGLIGSLPAIEPSLWSRAAGEVVETMSKYPGYENLTTLEFSAGASAPRDVTPLAALARQLGGE
jgi:hypothetical protein